MNPDDFKCAEIILAIKNLIRVSGTCSSHALRLSIAHLNEIVASPEKAGIEAYEEKFIRDAIELLNEQIKFGDSSPCPVCGSGYKYNFL